MSQHISQKNWQELTDPVGRKIPKLLQLIAEVDEALALVIDLVDYHDGDLDAVCEQLSDHAPDGAVDPGTMFRGTQVTTAMIQDYLDAAEVLEQIKGLDLRQLRRAL